MDIPKELVQGSKLTRGELHSLVYYARWISILRGYCIISNPIFIHTRLNMKGGLKKTFSAKQVTVPEDISDLLCEVFNYLDAREQFYPSGDLVLKPGKNKPWRDCNNPYVITKVNPIRLGDEIAEQVLGMVRCPYERSIRSDNQRPGASCEGIGSGHDESWFDAFRLTSYVIAWYYNSVSDRQVQIAPLTRHEELWVTKHAGRSLASLLGE